MTAVPHTEVRHIWPTVAPLLAKAVRLAKDRMDMASVFEWLQDRRYILWVTYEDPAQIRAAFVTREAVYPKRKLLAVGLAGGDGMTEWLPTVVDTFRRYARDAGLDGVEMAGRVGWTKPLKALGWTGDIVLLEVSVAAGDERGG